MSTEENIKAEAMEAKEKVEAAAEDAKEKVEAAADDVKAKAETAAEDVVEKAGDAVEAADEKIDKAVEKAEEDAEEVKKSAKQLKKEAKAEKKAAKAAKEAEAAAAAKKQVSTKTVALITIAICAVAVIGLVMFLNKPEQTLYEKVGKYDEYIKLGKYKGLEYTKETISVSKKEIKSEIDNRLSAKATTKDSKKGTVKDGDNVNISYVGKIDGKEFDGGTAENQTLTIGSGAFIKGFEEGLIGKKVGDKVTLDLKFPKTYGKTKNSEGKWEVSDKNAAKLAGKPVTFEVKINSKQVTKTPEYDEEFIKANSDYDNKKDYEASIKEELMKNKEETAENTAKQTLWSEAVENAEVKKNPKGAIKQEQDAIIEQYKLMAQNYNMEWEDFLKTYMQSSEKDFQKQAKTYAKSVVKQKLVLYAIADKENLEISNKDYKKRLDEMLKNAGMTKDQFKEQYNMTIEEYAEKNDFKANFLSEQVNDFIYKNAKAKAPEAKKKSDKKDN